MNYIQEAELACAKLLNQFTTLNDAGRYEDMAALFAEDGRFASPMVPDPFVTGREAIRDSFEERRNESVSRHLLSNIVIDVIDEKSAKGSAYSFLILGMPENNAELGIKANSSQFVGDYIVEFKKTHKGWEIAQLTAQSVFTT